MQALQYLWENEYHPCNLEISWYSESLSQLISTIKLWYDMTGAHQKLLVYFAFASLIGTDFFRPSTINTHPKHDLTYQALQMLLWELYCDQPGVLFDMMQKLEELFLSKTPSWLAVLPSRPEYNTFTQHALLWTTKSFNAYGGF